MSKIITRPMLLTADTLGFTSRSQAADDRLVLPVAPPVDILAPLPTRGMTLLTGVTGPKLLGMAMKRHDAQQYRYTSINLKVTVEHAIPSDEVVDRVHLAHTELLIFENTRMSIPLASAIHADMLTILGERYAITPDKKLVSYAPRSFKLLIAYPYVIADLMDRPDYAHIKVMLFHVPGLSTLRHRLLYLRDLSLISKVIITGEQPDIHWRLPTPDELDHPPKRYNPFEPVAGHA